MNFPIYPKIFDPPPEDGSKDPNKIYSTGAILNGRADIRDALQIRETNLLRTNLRRGQLPALDPVLAAHCRWHVPKTTD